MEVKLYASSNTSNYGISQTFTLEQLGLQEIQPPRFK